MARARSQAGARSPRPSQFDLEGGTEPDPDDVGTRVEVTWGSERISAVQYNTVEVGPFSMTVAVREGETVADAVRRGMEKLEVVAEQEFDQKMNGHFDRITRAAAAAKSR